MHRLCIFLFILVFTTLAFLNSGTAQTGEVLVTIPAASCMEAACVAPSPIHFYHRLPDVVIAGVTRASLPVLEKRGIECLILDDKPWTQEYAVVALPHPGKSAPDLKAISSGVILQGEDFVVMRSHGEYVQHLRGQGFVCVPIERQEIPMQVTKTRLPAGIAQNRDSVVDSLVSLVSDTSIRNYIQGMQNFGTRFWYNPNRDAVSRWVSDRYLDAGVTDTRLDSFQYGGTWQANVVATIPGNIDPARELIVGGHHDSYSSNTNQAPGADDNASGAAAAIEMARVLRQANYQPAYTMRFMGFAAEEAGLRGSASYAQRARQAGRDIRSMQNYDMIANRSQAPSDERVNIVWYTSSEAFADLQAAMMTSYTPLIPVHTTSSRSGSDSYSFWQQNYRTVFCIEKNFSPYYHSPNDLLQYLDMTYAANITRAGLAMLLTLDRMPPAVTGLRVRDCGDGTSLLASWNAAGIPDVSYYRIYVGRIPGVYDSIYTQASPTCSIGGLTPETGYIIGVSIVNLAGREGMVTELSAVARAVPLAPAGLTYAIVPGQGVLLRWRGNLEMDLRGYNVYRKALWDPGFLKLNPVPVADTTYLDQPIAGGSYRYYVSAVDSSGNQSQPSDTIFVIESEVREEVVATPFEFRLYPNFPNPFNPGTNIRFEVASPGQVTLEVFDAVGRRQATLVDEKKSPGIYVATWNAGDKASGVYFCILSAGGRRQSIRMVLMK